MTLRFREPRVKSERHLAFIRQLPCCICHNNIETQAAHVRFTCDAKINPGMQQKPSDRYTVPLCNRHHEEQHRMNEKVFWLTVGIDPHKLADLLWSVTGDHEAGERIALNATLETGD